ncbi:ATP-grasp domain-containing protein [Billgrantia sp. Q4P2]|uniref:ATP-grasp domain-containing protein n=1 Tax=Billgrantia sp. Q4P2 TaxID=3463857 RepID=UPI0040562735
MSWNIFVIGYDDLGRYLLSKLNRAQDYEFHGLLSLQEVVHAEEYPFDRLVSDALKELEEFSGKVDAIVGYWDFPTSALVPVLRSRLGLPGPSLEAVLTCEHKYWSRVEQRRIMSECVPSFQAIDPFDDSAPDKLEIDFPFWIKPIKAHSSHLGFLIESKEQLRETLPRIRRGIGRFGKPFDDVCAHADLPEEVAAVTGHHCIAESIISAGQQCTLEGYVQNGEVQLTGSGMIDSVRDEKHRSVLLRYEYPSRLPEAVQKRMAEYARRFMRHIVFDNGPFNIEFYYEEKSGRIWVLEVNPRLSRSHAAIYGLVDGTPHFQVMVDTALGIEPRMPKRQGRYPVAAKQMLRIFEDGMVHRIPTRDEIARVEATFPGAKVELNVEEGMRLADLQNQDSFSFELGVLFIGGESHEDLVSRIERCRDMLPFEIEPLSAGA